MKCFAEQEEEEKRADQERAAYRLFVANLTEKERDKLDRDWELRSNQCFEEDRLQEHAKAVHHSPAKQ